MSEKTEVKVEVKQQVTAESVFTEGLKIVEACHKAEKEYLNCKINVESITAQTYLEIKKVFLAEGTKVTEKQLEHELAQDKHVLEAQKQLVNATAEYHYNKKKADLYEAFIKTF